MTSLNPFQAQYGQNDVICWLMTSCMTYLWLIDNICQSQNQFGSVTFDVAQKSRFQLFDQKWSLRWSITGHWDIGQTNFWSLPKIQVSRIILVLKSAPWVKGKRENFYQTFVYPLSGKLGAPKGKIDSRKKILPDSCSEFSACSE